MFHKVQAKETQTDEYKSLKHAHNKTNTESSDDLELYKFEQLTKQILMLIM